MIEANATGNPFGELRPPNLAGREAHVVQRYYDQLNAVRTAQRVESFLNFQRNKASALQSMGRHADAAALSQAVAQMALQLRGAAQVGYVGQLTGPEQQIAFHTVVNTSFQAAWDSLPVETCWQKISLVHLPQNFSEYLAKGGESPPSTPYPDTVVIGFSPFNAQMHELVTQRHSNPLTRHSVTVPIKRYAATLHEERRAYDTDTHGTLRKVYRDLSRVEQKNPDRLLAGLLRNGATAPAYHTTLTGKNYFDTLIPCSPEGATATTYTNRFTGTPLTEENLARVCQDMMNRRGPDDVVLGLGKGGFQLIVPTFLQQNAIIATQLKTLVWSGSNSMPGQAAGTAAHADNPMHILKYVKDVVVLPELTDGGNVVDQTTWYVQDISAGPQALAYALGMPPEVTSMVNPNDYNVFWSDQYTWGILKAEGVQYGLPQWISRCEA